MVLSGKKEIFVVCTLSDDSEALGDILRSAGASICFGMNGEAALKRIKEKQIDLLLVDVCMLAMDGFVFYHRIKSVAPRLPVIFISAPDDEDTIQKGFEIGCNDYISKPFKKAEILSRISIQLEYAGFKDQLAKKTTGLQKIKKQFEPEAGSRNDAEIVFTGSIEVSPFTEWAVDFWDLFDINEIQKLQDQFSDAFSVASVITDKEGSPLTKPSNFTYLCQEIIRRSETGLKNCMRSDAIIGSPCPTGPIVQHCLSCGLWDAGASIIVGGKHVANWLIGQVRDRNFDASGLKEYANEIGVDENEFLKAFNLVPVMTMDRFRSIASFLYSLAAQLSQKAYQNVLQARFINERKTAEEALSKSEERLRRILYSSPVGMLTFGLSESRNLILLGGNPAADNILRTETGQMKGKTMPEAFPGFNDPVITEKAIQVALRELDLQIFEFDYQNRQVKRSLDMTVFYTGGNTITINFLDITSQKESERLLKKSEELYRSIFRMSKAVMLLIDPESGKIMDVNDAGVKFYGWLHEKIVGMNMCDINTWSQKEILKEMDKVVQNRQNYFKFIHRISDGTFRDVEVYSSPITLNNKQLLFSIIHDVSEKKRMEDQLRQSEERFRKAILEAPFPIMLHAEDGEVIAISRTWTELSGYSLQDLPTTWEWSRLAIGQNEDFLKSSFDNLSEHEHWVEEGEYVIMSKNGQKKVWDFGSASLGQLTDGRRLVISMAKDVSEQKKYEETIFNDRNLLRTLIDNLPVAVYIKDTNCKKIVSNVVDVKNAGRRDESQVLGKTDMEIFGKELGLQRYLDDLAVIQTRTPILNKEEKYIDKYGNIKWMLTSKMPLVDEDNQITGLVGISRDITEWKETKEQIEKLSQSIEQSPSSVMVTDLDGRIEYVNPRFCELTGYTKNEVLGKNPRILKSGEMPEDIYRQLWETLKTGKVWRGELRNKKKTGGLFWEWTIITPIKNDRGSVTNYIALKEDITVRKQMEIDLIEAKEKAEESDRLKSAFLANMSHEIRTPLNSIVGFSELLADDSCDTDQKKEFIHHIVSNGNSLLSIINDIIDISKIESGQIRIRKEKTDATKLLTEIARQYFLKAEEKGIKLMIRTPLDKLEKHVCVLADPDRLTQILNNLLSNALKFTAKGEINVGYQIGNKTVEFFVSDTGIGIPEDFYPRLFNRFSQVENSYSRQYGGNGLGLAISKSLVELMGGRIWFKSKSGAGSTFFFTLPKLDCRSGSLI